MVHRWRYAGPPPLVLFLPRPPQSSHSSSPVACWCEVVRQRNLANAQGACNCMAIRRKKSVSFEADAGGTGPAEAAQHTATCEPSAGPPAPVLPEAPEQKGMHCGGLRAGEGTKGNPNPAGAAQVEHRELSWWAAPSEHSGDQWSAPSRRMSAPTRLPYRPPGWAAPAPPPDPDYEDVSSRPALPPGLLNPARDQLARLVETLPDPKKEADRHFLFTACVANADAGPIVRAPG
ncbi:hypothetical protein CYMTET_34186 [Cymbomonas tetramitiformis]|uniref:Uncharacterized protein n=1 Tax=Cymbomonas tetramitiformis TaxID=36881 RepID=A0AAE0KQG2_9CHLO|nr:hypothetical protein CYMTET_34186 [Cymbomonas tetramitiformis]